MRSQGQARNSSDVAGKVAKDVTGAISLSGFDLVWRWHSGAGLLRRADSMRHCDGWRHADILPDFLRAFWPRSRSGSGGGGRSKWLNEVVERLQFRRDARQGGERQK